MKIAKVIGLISISILLTSCGSRNGSEAGAASPAKTLAETAPASEEVQAAPAAAAPRAAAPVTQPILMVWQEGDKAEAVRRFLAADWSARPIFPAGMALNLSEDQFKALPEADRQLKSKEMIAQLDLMKQLAVAVAQAGREAAANGDVAQARKCFTSLKQFGAALETPERLRLVQMVGQVSEKMGDNELAKIGK